MNISYDSYRVFYFVAHYQNVTQAAQALMNTQPNVTRIIKNLESALGCTLFLRSNRGVRLTPEGERLYPYAAAAVEQLQAGEAALTACRELKEGMISIGASEVALRCFLLPVLCRFHQLHAGVRIRVSNYSTPQALSALQNGLVDFSVVTTPLDTGKALALTELKPFRERAVCGAPLSALSRRPLTLAELSAYPLICLAPDTGTHAFYSRLFSEEGLTLRPDIEVATADQILPLVKSGLGIGFVPEDFLLEESARMGVHPLTLDPPLPPRAICLVRRTDRPLSMAAQAFLGMLSEESAAKAKKDSRKTFTI